MFIKLRQWAAQIWKNIKDFYYINNNFKQTVQMFENNQGILTFVKNLYLYKQLKYIDISYYFIRDLIEKKRFDIVYIPIGDIITNGITKPLVYIAYKRFRNQLRVVDFDTFKTI